MNQINDEALKDYYREAETWASDREQHAARSQRLAWWIAGGAGAIALLEGIALVTLLPLKTVVPYTLLVDRQTGYVQALQPLTRETVSPDRAMVRSFLAQYVIARESFDVDALQESYRKVALWSAEDARSGYIAGMQASNPSSPLATLPRRALVTTEIRSISPLNADTALVRFSTLRRDPGAQPQERQLWAAVLKYRFSGEAMGAEDRLTNPLGFQVLRYHRDAEIVPEVQPAAAMPGQATVVPGQAIQAAPAAPRALSATAQATPAPPK